jgi:hypothetical protein
MYVLSLIAACLDVVPVQERAEPTAPGKSSVMVVED